jgi:hypothetical protein
LPFDARTVNFQQQRQEHFRRHQSEQARTAARHPEIGLSEIFDPAMPSAVNAQTYAPASRKLAPGRSSR